MRGQIYFRDQDVTADGAPVVGGVGIIEVPQGHFAENAVRGLTMTGGPDRFELSLTSYFRDVADDDHVAAAEIDSAALLPVWPLPSPLVGDVDGGGIMVRRTRMPAAPGMEIVSCVALLKAPAKRLARDVMYAISGHLDTPPDVTDPRHMPFSGRLVCADPRPVPGLVSRGHNLHQLLKQPVWGFGEEGRAFNSTMSLALIDLCDEAQALMAMAAGEMTPEQRERLEALRRTEARWVLSIGDKDPEYQAYRRAMVAEFGPVRFDGTLTASEKAAREEAADRILGEVMAAREASYGLPAGPG